MSDTDRNRLLGELADALHAADYPKRARTVDEMDEYSVRAYYRRASVAIRFLEERLAREPQVSNAGSAVEAAQSEPPLKATCQPPPDPDDFVPEPEHDLCVQDVLAEPDPELDENLPF